jgi:hypothetical protein
VLCCQVYPWWIQSPIAATKEKQTCGPESMVFPEALCAFGRIYHYIHNYLDLNQGIQTNHSS